MRIAVVALAVVVLAGCYGPGFKVVRGAYDHLEPVAPGSKVLITTPLDGEAGNVVYAGSGHTVALAVRNAALRRFSDVEVIASATAEHARDRCEAEGAVVIAPEILRWEDHMTSWSGIADKLIVKLTLHDRGAQREMAFKAHSTFYTLTDEPPEYLLNSMFAQAVLELLNPAGPATPPPQG